MVSEADYADVRAELERTRIHLGDVKAVRARLQAENERLAVALKDWQTIATDHDEENARLRNAIGDVRGMQSDGATPEEMDHALGRALRGLVPRVTFDKARSRAATDEKEPTA